MRICIVTVASYAHGIGGMQAHSADLCRGLVEAGHEVEVISARHPEGLTQTEHLGATWHFYDATSRRPGRPFRNRDWLTPPLTLSTDLHAARPFDVVHSESTSALGLLRRESTGEVPSRPSSTATISGSPERQFGADARVRLTAARPRGQASRLAYRSAMWSRRTSSSVSAPARRWSRRISRSTGTVRSYSLDRSRVHVVPNGISVEDFAARQGRGAPEPRARARPILLCVGRLARDKGFATAIEALARIGNEDARLLILGSGPERALLEQTARKAGVSDRVDFLGSKPRAEVADHLAASDVFLFPTERDEAAPLVPLEAMAAGLPVVASDIGGGAELIESGRTGLLVPPAAVDSLAGAIDSLLVDDALRRRMGEAARERIVERYTIEAMTRQTVAVYELAAKRLQKDG